MSVESGQHSSSAANFNSKKPFGSAARLYREAGWYGVLPLPQGKKNPPPKGYTGAGKAYPTEKTIESWITSNAKGNISLRLAEVEREYWPSDLPAVYAGNVVDGWELIGIDVDDYKGKEGGNQREALESMYGELPATALSSARWGSGGASCISIYLVPKGYRFMGKAADSIEIIQKRHRYMAAWPSVNPDAPTAIVDGAAVPAQYSWRWGRPKDVGAAADNADARPVETINGIPAIAVSEGDTDEGEGREVGRGVAVLPEAWFNFLSRQGERETEDAISSLSDNELFAWLTGHLRWEGEPCKRVSNALAKGLAELEDSPDSHTWLNTFMWHLLNLAAEGHSGIGQALSEYLDAWTNHAVEQRGAAPEDLTAEIDRSILGALNKIEPKYVLKPPGAEYADSNATVEHLPLADDICVGGEIDNVDRLGPVIGPMQVSLCPPADEYDQSDSGNGLYFVHLHGNNMRFVASRQNWVFWSGQRWHEDGGGALAALAFERVRQNQIERAEQMFADLAQYDLTDPNQKAQHKIALAQAKGMQNWYLRSGDGNRVKNALISARKEWWRDTDALDADGQLIPGGEVVPMYTRGKLFDQKPKLLACSNGVVELTDDPWIRSPRKDDYITFNTNVPFMSWRSVVNSSSDKIQQQCSDWTSFLDMVLPNPDVQEYVQKVLGYGLIGGNPEKMVVFMEGQTNTGKSTMLTALRNALGDYCGATDAKIFRDRDFNPPLANNVYKRVVVISEPNTTKDNKMDADKVKSIAGDDPVVMERKYSNDIETEVPHFLPIIACNAAPEIVNADEAFLKRVCVLPFHTAIPAEVVSNDRRTATVEASTAVLAWLVEGWVKYCENPSTLKMDKPEAVSLAQAEFTDDLNIEGNAIEVLMKQYVTANFMTKHSNPDDYGEALQAAHERAKQRGRSDMNVLSDGLKPGDWPQDWTPLVADAWNPFVELARQRGHRVSSRAHGLMFRTMLGVGDAVARKVGGVAHKVYVGVKLTPNAGGKLGKWG